MGTTIDQVYVSRETLISARELYAEQFENMEKYIDELLWWNKKLNLVSRDVSRETLQKHLIHSLLPSPMGLLQSISDWVDAGTGGGLPGIPLALTERDKKWILNDITSKKVAAVKQMVHKLNLLNASGQAGSLGDLELDSGSGVISKHAFSVQDILKLMDNKPWERLIMYKGAKESIEECKEVEGGYSILVYIFNFGKDESFYQGKGLLVVNR